MKTAHRRQGRAKQALRHIDFSAFLYPDLPHDDHDEVEAPEPTEGQPQQPEQQGEAA